MGCIPSSSGLTRRRQTPSRIHHSSGYAGRVKKCSFDRAQRRPVQPESSSRPESEKRHGVSGTVSPPGIGIVWDPAARSGIRSFNRNPNTRMSPSDSHQRNPIIRLSRWRGGFLAYLSLAVQGQSTNAGRCPATPLAAPHVLRPFHEKRFPFRVESNRP